MRMFFDPDPIVLFLCVVLCYIYIDWEFDALFRAIHRGVRGRVFGPMAAHTPHSRHHAHHRGQRCRLRIHHGRPLEQKPTSLHAGRRDRPRGMVLSFYMHALHL